MTAQPPVVASVGANNLTATTANVSGTVNPQSETGTWWFTYTTGSTTLTTTETAIAATSTPQTVTATLAALQTGQDYTFAVVCQTSGGTVTSSPLGFTPISPPAAPIATGVPNVAVPHFQFPFVQTDTGAAVVEQDSYAEIISCVQAIAVCPNGACPELPTFGRGPDPTFMTAPPSSAALIAAIQLWEPRADETAVVTALDRTQANYAISLNTAVTGTDAS